MKETMIDTEVTYTLEYNGKFVLIEHVPARVCRETGEQFFAPGDTAARLAIYLGTSPDVWINLQARYDAKIAQRQLMPSLAGRIRPKRQTAA